MFSTYSNVSQASITTSKCKPTRPQLNTSLVAEGGGQRGIFTAGVLDSWLYKGFNPFDLLIGTSAGAQNLSSYMTCQQGFDQRAIFNLTKNLKFFKLGRALIVRDAVNLDWYFDQVASSSQGLDVDCGMQRLKARTLLFSVIEMETRAALYFEPNKDNWLDLLKASSALPILYRGRVKLGQQHYVDGGLAAPVPVEEAYKRGAKRTVVIRTVPKEGEIEYPWAHRLKGWICSSNRCPRVIDLITHHETEYQRAQNFMDKPPEDVEIVQIYPQKPLASGLVGSSCQDLNQDYIHGVKVGLAFLQHQALDRAA